jgi:hypothetical protein
MLKRSLLTVYAISCVHAHTSKRLLTCSAFEFIASTTPQHRHACTLRSNQMMPIATSASPSSLHSRHLRRSSSIRFHVASYPRCENRCTKKLIRLERRPGGWSAESTGSRSWARSLQLRASHRARVASAWSTATAAGMAAAMGGERVDSK